MDTIKIDQVGKKPSLNHPILLEGLPGIGNVGKVAVDFIIEELNAKKLYEIYSYTFPHSVFVNENNLVELPKVEIYYKEGKNDLLLLAGDVQPIDEVSSYDFSERILNIFEQFNGKEIITMGGIGLAEVPKKPKLYCTGNSKNIIERYKGSNVNVNLYGVVGPIVGVSGLLLGLAARRRIEAISLLAETYAHPLYLGMQGAKEILSLLNAKLKLNIDIKKMDKEIKEVEKDIINKTEELNEVMRQTALRKLHGRLGDDVSYIG